MESSTHLGQSMTRLVLAFKCDIGASVHAPRVVDAFADVQLFSQTQFAVASPSFVHWGVS